MECALGVDGDQASLNIGTGWGLSWRRSNPRYIIYATRVDSFVDTHLVPARIMKPKSRCGITLALTLLTRSHKPRMQSVRALIALLLVVAAGCVSERPEAPQAAPVSAAYGVIEVRFIDNRVVRDSSYPPGAYDVPLDVNKATAFDGDSARTSICTRADNKAFELASGPTKHYRFQCDTSWNSRSVVFVADTAINIKRGEMLEWKKLDGEPPLARPRSADAASLHSYAQVATPAQLDGLLLVNAAWFSGQYPPKKEFDDLRGDSITFGHYTIRDRVLFIGQSPARASTYLLRRQDTVQVSEPLEWAFFPDDASEKNEGSFSTIYEIPSGYLLRVFQMHDHEGFGVDEFTRLYLYESGQWRLFAKADRFRAY